MLPVYKIGESRFRRSGDTIAGVEIKNGSCDSNHAPFRSVFIHKLRLAIDYTCVQDLTIQATTKIRNAIQNVENELIWGC